jgi:hypothetical protein
MEIKNHKKGIAIEGGLIALLVVSGFISVFLVVNKLLDDSSFRKTEEATLQHTAANAANIGMLFHRQVMYRYYVWAGMQTIINRLNCQAPSSFLQILKDGTKCGGPSTSSSPVYFLFAQTQNGISDSNTEVGNGKNIYSYSNQYCSISYSGSDCSGTGINKLVVTVGVQNPAQKVAGHIYKYYLVGFDAVRLRAEYLIEIISPSGKIHRHQLTIGDDADMIFVQGNSSLVTNFAKSDAICPTTLWGDFYIFNSDPLVRACEKPPLIGTQGLANFAGNLLGFRNQTGEFFDMGSSSSSLSTRRSGRLIASDDSTSGTGASTRQASYETITEAGTLPTSGRSIFIPHKREHLIGVEDVDTLTLADRKGQLFYLKGTGKFSHIGIQSLEIPDRPETFPVCDLGSRDVGVTWESLGVSSSSDSLVTSSDEQTRLRAEGSDFRLATFFLKSATGAFYRAYVVQNLVGTQPLSVANSMDETVIQCFVIGDDAQSRQVEYRRVFAGTPASGKRLWNLN